MSLRRVGYGSAYGILIGVALGLAMGMIPVVRAITEPVVTFLRALSQRRIRRSITTS